MADWELRDPWFLLVALLAPLVYYLAAGRNPATATYSTLSVLDGAARTWRVRLMPVPAILLALAVVAMALALGGPRIGDDQTRVRREGIAIVMVVSIVPVIIIGNIC